MKTFTSQDYIYSAATKKSSFTDKLVNAYRENRVSIICGLLAMSGTSNVYPVYKALSE